jgi:DNA-binding LytR/AlgR family response regulator
MLNVMICDEEVFVLDQLKEMIEEDYADSRVTCCQDCKKLLEEIMDTTKEIDLLIIGIQMKKNGIEVSKRILLERPKLSIVFISNYTKYCEDIFQIQPKYFLQKPITKVRFRKAFEKVIELIDIKKNTFIYDYNGMILKADGEKIYYIESERRILRVFGYKSEKIIYMKMNLAEKSIPENFIRIHQSYIINANYLKSFSKKSVELITGEILPVSQKRYKEAQKKVILHLQRKYNKIKKNEQIPKCWMANSVTNDN